MNNWKKIPLGKILTESKVISENPDADKRITVLLYGRGVEKRPITSEKEGATKYHTRRAGQFIYGKQNLHKGAFGVVPDELDGFESSSDIPAFDVDASCLPEWICYYLRQGKYYEQLSKIARGMASKRIHPEDFFLEEIPLPLTISEQKNVLKELKHKEEQHKILVEELFHQQYLVKRIRQSILQDAVKGKLVKQNPKDEPATELLKGIKAEKEKLVKQGKIKKEKPLLPITAEEIPYELPKGWVWCRLGEITVDVSYGTSEKAVKENVGIPVLRMGNITLDGEILFDDLKYVDSRISDLPKLYLNDRDLIFNRTNSLELVGKSAVFTQQDIPYTLASYLIRVRFFETINSFFVTLFVNSNICRQEQIMPNVIQQNGQANFNGSKMKSIVIPIAPLAEQNRIVEKVNQLMNLCSSLEKEIAHSKQEADYLLNAILRETFQQKPKEYSQNETPLSIAAEP